MTAPAATFFLLVFALSVPFYLLGAIGGRLPGLPILPVSALMTFVPIAAAMILIYRQHGSAGIAASFRRAVDSIRPKDSGWYLVALLFPPAVCALEFGILRFTGTAVPFPQIALSDVAFLFLAFFVGAVGEEFGWQGYAYPALKTRLNALTAALVIGVIWALWHVIPFSELGRSTSWILWHSLCAVALRVIIVWLFQNAGKSVFVAVLFHTMINVSWALFPVSGSYYDPFVAFEILLFAAALIVFAWGPSELGRFRFGENNKQDA